MEAVHKLFTLIQSHVFHNLNYMLIGEIGIISIWSHSEANFT